MNNSMYPGQVDTPRNLRQAETARTVTISLGTALCLIEVGEWSTFFAALMKQTDNLHAMHVPSMERVRNYPANQPLSSSSCELKRSTTACLKL